MLNPWYVSGFCDGEAAFTYSRTGGSFGIYFAIKQREDNQQIVDEIRQYFNYIGYVYRSKPTKNSGFSKSSAYFRVTKINELKIVIDHFDRYPLQSIKKRTSYEVWRKMVVHKLENYRNVKYDILKQLADQLSQSSLQNRLLKSI